MGNDPLDATHTFDDLVSGRFNVVDDDALQTQKTQVPVWDAKPSVMKVIGYGETLVI